MLARDLIRRCVTPHPSVVAPEFRRRTRLILVITLIAIPVEVIDVSTSWAYAGTQGVSPAVAFLTSLVTLLAIVATYAVARSRHALASFPLFIALVLGLCWLYVYETADPGLHTAIQAFPVLGIVLTALFFGPIGIGLVTLLNMAAVFATGYLQGDDWVVTAMFATTFALSGMFLIAASAMRERDALTIRERTAEAQQGEARFQTLADSALEGIIIHEQGRILDANDAACRLYGYAPGELVGMRTVDLVTPSARELVMRLAEENPAGAVEVVAQRKDGSTFTVQSYGRPLPYAGRTVRVSSVRDVSAERELTSTLEKARRAATEASAAKSNFLATVSHELRTPLNAILGYAQLVEDHPDPAARDMLAMMRSSAEHLARMVGTILDFTKSEAGGFVLAAEPSDLARILRECVGGHAAAANAKGLRLETYLPPEPISAVLVDGARVRQVLDQLLRNAVEFTEVGQVDARLEVRPEAPHDGRLRAVFTIRDTGPGLPAGVAEQLFSPFTQGDGSMTRSHGGLGLGLAVARSLARAMGGDVTLAGDVGGGTVAHFHLVAPVVSPDAPLPVPARANPSPGHAPADVLVAEDDPMNQKVLVRLLQRCGRTAHVVPDGEQAVEAAATGAYRLVLMDIHMPGMDGLEASRRIRAGGARLPIVAVTADALVGDREKCLAAGMDDYLAKPVVLERLRAVLDRFAPVVTAAS